VKAGSILPMAPKMDYTDQRSLDPLVLDIYAGKRATFRLYEDDGASLDYRKNAFAWTPIGYEPAAGPGRQVITIGPTEGRYLGQTVARRYTLQIHGLLRPARVLRDGRALSERRPDEGGAEGWIWHPAEQVTEVDLTEPIDIRTATTVTLEQSGQFQDALAVQAARAYRERVRRVQVVEKLRWAMLLNPGGLLDPGNEPRVVQVTEGVEQALNDIIDHPAGLGERLPDLKAMTAAILDAIANRPFASTRRQPDKDRDFVAGQEQVARGSFTADEQNRMTAELLGCELESGVAGNAMIFGTTVEGPILRARARYDATCIGPPQLHYELAFPDDGPPGWAEVERSVGRHFNEVAWQKSRYFDPSEEDESATFFKIRAPFPPRPGSHPLKLKVTMSWGPIRTVLEREVDWIVGSDPVDPAKWDPSD
jgi:hypothetical protein